MKVCVVLISLLQVLNYYELFSLNREQQRRVMLLCILKWKEWVERILVTVKLPSQAPKLKIPSWQRNYGTSVWNWSADVFLILTLYITLLHCRERMSVIIMFGIKGLYFCFLVNYVTVISQNWSLQYIKNSQKCCNWFCMLVISKLCMHGDKQIISFDLHELNITVCSTFDMFYRTCSFVAGIY